ncbi:MULTISPECIES: UDP-N-acetylmuramoyl-tripeptide--D-alanyl-D-alanine ligase [Psychrilyobacter]|uniref:UDP-N-acetylmuramoyl-tripeptide--D-alanyl-D-alanine ligase n=1 Tax=Psychrilyobacter piezotolerans TaxID=2293438 RepID=A0ABX9KF67_9FUSO|nr:MULTISPECIES: UDP-N-acetylmuramoyl-tripeptide--D-alanyl-D-alanine ligase [Psychrilyobacter]MCS5421558.1 UDP-N-acetylmuramoyl-tripeptide--D-alanyl-D-alanine ligase [Psychrilyobacter sp. S5]NDI78681.1 UDP-N-acetylmuramoyl-tripeptide--D-alanyl-D-alanine ligase [Psychrilyobacter piezotolerans]RDE60030.1 UDP-N-acetylmuramoyl-tripeptide--D-alanyl-D-alanine ligase [Psychrilyobacter sp. S5]REI40257.1 UDP-N-acetylmuramoyl-tripeptide--D-alanyl-D-alanine ligase [Psychrilyobacter piezotolerans]
MQKLVFFNKMYPNQKNLKDIEIGEIHIDSRKVKKNDVFIGIRSGNEYIQDVLEKGACLVFYDDINIKIEDERAIYVENSILFLQELAKKYRESLDVTVIGITGSEGKTSTKDILYSILSQKYKGKKTQGNYNNHIGLPLTLLQLEEGDKFIALEMGMSNLGEIRLLGEIASPDYAVVTNIGDSHLEFLENRDNVFKAKTEIFDFVKPEFRVVYGDDPYFKDAEAVRVGKNRNNDYIISGFHQDKRGGEFKLSFLDEEIEVQTNLYGEYNSINIALAMTVALKMEVPKGEILDACKNLKLTGMRFERVEKDGKIFINDAYNASPVAMKVSLETFDEIFKGDYKVAILGDMLELGKESGKLHEGLSKTIEKLNLDEVYLVGKEMKNLYMKLDHKNCFYFETTEEIGCKVEGIKDGAVIFLKASNGICLNKILD